MKINSKQGFTLLEVMASITLLVLAMAMALTGYMFSLKNINQSDVQNELDIDVQLAIERLKVDLRLSSLDSMFYYPSGAGPYEALSFSMANDNDGDGVLEQDDEGNILWDETVIYHIRPTTPNQLVRTTFNPRDNSLTDAQRQAQLESVVSYGDGTSTYNSGNAVSDVIFENLLNWKINPKAGWFDAYSPVLSRDSSSLGYILLDPGDHEFTFKVISKNSSSSGYKIGIDQLFVSPSYSEREAEAQLPVTAQSGATVASQYMPGDWKGNYHLTFPATQEGNSFTLTLDNDRWEETNFDGVGYLASNTTVRFDTSLSPSNFSVQLSGMDTAWSANAQTTDLYGNNTASNQMHNWAMRTILKGSDLAENGGWIDYNGRKCKVSFMASATNHLAIHRAYIGESASSTNLNMNYRSTSAVYPITFSGSSAVGIWAGTSVESDWVNLSIDRDKNYVIAYSIYNNPDIDAPKQWLDMAVSITNRSEWTTQIAKGVGDIILNSQNWSGQGFTIDPTNRIFGLESVYVSYPETGEYTSQIFDTHLSQPQYGDIEWDADDSSGTTSLSLKVRTGSQPDLSDASDWDLISESSVNPHSVGASYNKRYIQFKALLGSDTSGTSSPKLKDVTIDWEGERQLVDIGGIFTKGPDYGMFEISVDGDPLRSALIVDLEIYKDVLVMNKESRRITSFLKVDLTPRNSGK